MAKKSKSMAEDKDLLENNELDTFTADMKKTAELLLVLYDKKRDRYPLINKLIRGLTNGEYSPEDIIDVKLRGSHTICIYLPSPLKTLPEAQYWLRFHLKDAIESEFQNVEVEYVLGTTTVKLNTVSFNPGDF